MTNRRLKLAHELPKDACDDGSGELVAGKEDLSLEHERVCSHSLANSDKRGIPTHMSANVAAVSEATSPLTFLSDSFFPLTFLPFHPAPPLALLSNDLPKDQA